MARRTTVGVLVVLVPALLVVWVSIAGSDDSLPRVGAEERFETLEAWTVDRVPGLRATSEGEILRIHTPVWSKRPIPGLATGGGPRASEMRRTFDDVDLEQYPFLVVEHPRREAPVWMEVNGTRLPVPHTTGMHALDVRDYGLRGSGALRVAIGFLNTGGVSELDGLRFVARLSDEERAHLVPTPYRVPIEKLDAAPYHDLEALLRREGGFVLPRHPEAPEEALFRDTGTGALVRQLTGGPGRSFRPGRSGFSSTGRYFLFEAVERGRSQWLYDLQTEEISPLPLRPNDAVFLSGHEILFLQTSRGRGPGRAGLELGAIDLETRRRETLVELEVDRAHSRGLQVQFAPGERRALVSTRAAARAWILDAAPSEPADRIVELEIPHPVHSLRFGDRPEDLFGFIEGTGTRMHLRRSEARRSRRQGRTVLTWSQDAWHVSAQGGYGHGPGDPGVKVSNYPPAKVLERRGALTDDRPGDRIELVFNWREPRPETDYGEFSPDFGWAGADGVGGGVAGQFVLMSLVEPATLLQVAFHGASSLTNKRKPFLAFSPDATKLFYSSDQLGTPRLYYVVLRRPDPPRAVSLERRSPERGRLTWTPADGQSERRGFRVYAADKARRYRLHADEVAAPPLEVPLDAEHRVFRVASMEPSGLESTLSDPVAFAPQPPLRLLREAERGELEPPLRLHFDGEASAYRAAVVKPARPEERDRAGAVVLSVDVPSTGRWHAALRARGGRLRLATQDGRTLGSVEALGSTWAWRAGPSLDLERGRQELRIEATAPGVGLDALSLWSGDAAGALPPQPVEDAGLRWQVPGEEALAVKAQADSPFAMELRWEPGSESLRAAADHYRVFAASGGETPRPRNAHVLARTRDPSLRDVGLDPGTSYAYRVRAVDPRGRVLAEGRTEARTPRERFFRERFEAEGVPRRKGLTREREGSTTYVASAPGRRGRLGMELKVPRRGRYVLWLRHRVRGADTRQARLKLGEQRWSVDFHPFVLPGRRVGLLKRKPEARVGERWYTDPLLLGYERNTVDLDAGTHELALQWKGGRGRGGDVGWIEIDHLTVTDDLSWRPEGYDPRLDFRAEPGTPEGR